MTALPPRGTKPPVNPTTRRLGLLMPLPLPRLTVLACLLVGACATARATRRGPAVEVQGPRGTVLAPQGFPLAVESAWAPGDAVYDCFPAVGADLDDRGTADALELRLVFSGRSVRVEAVHSQTGLDAATRRCVESSLVGMDWQIDEGEVVVPFTVQRRSVLQR